MKGSGLPTDWPGPDAEPEFRDCAERGLCCWRGMTTSSGVGVAETRSDRKPRSMALDLSRACDEWFEQRFGWRARSNHTLFVSGSREQAAQFGTPVIVLPVAPARYLWSPCIADLTQHLRERGVSQPQEVAAVLEAGDYRETDLGAAIASGREIMVGCERYYWSVSSSR